MYYIGQSMTDPVLFRQMKQEMDEIDEIARHAGEALLIAFGMDLASIFCWALTR